MRILKIARSTEWSLYRSNKYFIESVSVQIMDMGEIRDKALGP